MQLQNQLHDLRNVANIEYFVKQFGKIILFTDLRCC